MLSSRSSRGQLHTQALSLCCSHIHEMHSGRGGAFVLGSSPHIRAMPPRAHSTAGQMKHVWLSYRQPHEAHVETEAQEGPVTCPCGQSVCLEGAGPPATSKVTAFSCLLVRQDASRGSERAACGQEGVKRRAGLWGGTSSAAASQVHCFLF